jgi:hypothetical protein
VYQLRVSGGIVKHGALPIRIDGANIERCVRKLNRHL